MIRRGERSARAGARFLRDGRAHFRAWTVMRARSVWHPSSLYGLLETPQGTAWMAASESVALESAGFKFMRDVAPGEAVFIDVDGHMQRRQCAAAPALNPCLFEYVYLARPDSCLDGVPVYEARLRMGDYLAQKISRVLSSGEIDA